MALHLLPYVAAARGQFAAGLALRLTLSRKARGIGLGGAAIERRAPVASYAGAMALSLALALVKRGAGVSSKGAI